AHMLRGLGEGLAHDSHRTHDTVEPGVVDHLDDGGYACSLVADEPGRGAVELHLRGGVRPIPALVLQADESEIVLRAVRQEAGQEETADAGRRLGEDEKGFTSEQR